MSHCALEGIHTAAARPSRARPLPQTPYSKPLLCNHDFRNVGPILRGRTSASAAGSRASSSGPYSARSSTASPIRRCPSRSSSGRATSSGGRKSSYCASRPDPGLPGARGAGPPRSNAAASSEGRQPETAGRRSRASARRAYCFRLGSERVERATVDCSRAGRKVRGGSRGTRFGTIAGTHR